MKKKRLGTVQLIVANKTVATSKYLLYSAICDIFIVVSNHNVKCNSRLVHDEWPHLVFYFVEIVDLRCLLSRF